MRKSQFVISKKSCQITNYQLSRDDIFNITNMNATLFLTTVTEFLVILLIAENPVELIFKWTVASLKNN